MRTPVAVVVDEGEEVDEEGRSGESGVKSERARAAFLGMASGVERPYCARECA